MVLVGDKRRKVEQEYRLTQRLGEERQLHANLEKRIQGLAAKQQTSTAPLNTADQQEFDDLKASLQRIKQSKDRMEMLRDEVVNLCTEVVRCWGTSEKATMESSDELFMTDMVFPGECNISAFYQYAALLLAPMHWNDLPFKGTYLRNMKKALQVYAQDLQSEIFPNDEDADSEMQQIDDIVANFNACCDVVETEEKKAAEQGRMQEWLDLQGNLWSDAKTRQRRWLDLVMGWRAPIQTVRILDKFTDVIRELTREKETDTRISTAAQGVLDSRNGEVSSTGIVSDV